MNTNHENESESVITPEGLELGHRYVMGNVNAYCPKCQSTQGGPYVSITTPEFVNASRSHHLELGRTTRTHSEPFTREEVCPILRVTMPRVGTVRAEFSADRYVASYADEGDKLTPWRVILRDVRTDDEAARPASGVGPATRDQIAAVCEPVILTWLESDEYKKSRKRAAAHAVRRSIADNGTPSYGVDRSRETVSRCRAHLDPNVAATLSVAINHLDTAGRLLDSTM
jgi:hypothetical protein